MLTIFIFQTTMLMYMKVFRTVIALVFIALMLAGSFAGCAAPVPDASGFNMIFKYGITAKNELNTFEGSYTKDMIMDPPITVDMVLSEEELDIILQKMMEIDFINYPDRFAVEVAPGEMMGQRTPFPSYYFKVEYDSQVKELWWDDKIINESEKADRLRELINLIIGIIESKEEYKKLPAPRGGYA